MIASSQEETLTFEDALKVYSMLERSAKATKRHSHRTDDGWLLRNANGPVARVRLISGIAFASTAVGTGNEEGQQRPG